MPDKKRFLILTSDSGFGHRSSANSIAKALTLQHPSDVEVSIVNPIFEESVASFLKKAELSYDSNVKNHPAIYRFAYEISESPSIKNLMEDTLTFALQKTLRQLLTEWPPNAIASTNQMFNAPVTSVLSDLDLHIPFFTIVTDLAEVHAMWFNEGPDHYYVASERVKAKALTLGMDPNKITISGIPVDPAFKLSEASPQEMRLKLGIDPDLTTLLVVGSKRVSGIFENLVILENISEPFQVVAIAGGDDDLNQRLNEHAWPFPIHVENYVDNVPEWMQAADLLVTKAGGLILSEGLAAGLPIILIDYLPGQEEGNVDFILDNDAGVIAETPEIFYQTVASWLKEHQKRLTARAQNARALGRPDAAIVIANALWQAAENSIPTMPPSHRKSHEFQYHYDTKK